MRVKDIVVLRNEKTTDTSRRYIGLENITSWDARFVETTSETEGTNNIFYPNDILFGKLRPYLAKGYIPKYDGICSTEFFVMSCKSGVLPHYLLYVFLSHSVIDFIKNQVAGVKMPRTNWDEFGNLNIDLPSLSVQQKMVDYLDEKTSAIDTRVELFEKKKEAYTRLKKAMINRAVTRGLDEHVKLKDSGVEWIGMIPEHWEMKRIKDVVILRNEKAVDVSMPYIALENIVSWNANYVETDAETEGTNNIFKSGDILFGKLRPYLAKGYIPTYDGICSTEFFVMKPGNMVSNRFLLYYILSQRVIDFIKNKVAGVKMPRTNWNEFGSLSVNTPPFAEQQSIAAYLDEKCAKIDAAIANIDKQMDALKRLKRSLINEVISGKRMIE